MTTSRFVVRQETEADIDEAYRWYEERSPGLGGRFLNAIEATIALLREAPQRFPVFHRAPDLVIRRALVEGFPYALFFIWSDRSGDMSVIACMHARRDPRRWLSRV